MLIPKLIHYALCTIKRNVVFDESHALGHGLKVLHFAHNILESELPNHQYLDRHRNIIYTASLLHDLCDNKYVDELNEIKNIDTFLRQDTTLTPHEIDVSTDIIQSMSYSKIKKVGYPDLGAYQHAFHIVREADLLAAYDFDRSILYNLHNVDANFTKTFNNALELFDKRIFLYRVDRLFVTEYSKQVSVILEEEARDQIHSWKTMLEKKKG